MPTKFRSRPAFVLWHRWFGMLAAIWLLLLALTGSVLVFYEELDSLLNSDLRRIQLGQEIQPVSSWVEAALEGRQNSYVRSINFPNHADAPAVLTLVDLTTDASLAVYINPYDADVLGTRSGDVISLGRRHIMNTIYALHIDLLLGEVMQWFLGLVALAWLIDHIVSVYLSFPTKKKWLRSFGVRFASGGYKRLFDLHRAAGLYLLPVTFVVAFSGLYFNWYGVVVHAVESVAPYTPRYIFTLPEYKGKREQLNYASVLDTVFTSEPDIDVDMMSYLPRQNVYEIRVFDEKDIDPYGRRTLVALPSGEIVSDRHRTDGGWGNVLLAWQYPLHSGKAFGWLGRIIIFISGIFVIWLTISGIKIFLRKRLAAQKSA